jgi:hypothetical protein
MRHTAIAALTICMAPLIVWAEEGANRVSGTVGDLVIDVSIWSEQSDFYGNGNSGGVSIMTKPVAPDQGLGAISISFEGSDFQNSSFSSFELSVADIEAGNMSGYFADTDNDLQIEVIQAKKQDGVLSLSGSVQGTLTWRKLMPISERAKDQTRQLPVALDFDVTVENEF